MQTHRNHGGCRSRAAAIYYASVTSLKVVLKTRTSKSMSVQFTELRLCEPVDSISNFGFRSIAAPCIILGQSTSVSIELFPFSV